MVYESIEKIRVTSFRFMAELVLHPDFIKVRNELVSRFGEKLPFQAIYKFSIEVSKTQGIPIVRDTYRNRDSMVNWIAENWNGAKQILMQIKQRPNDTTIKTDSTKNNKRIARVSSIYGKVLEKIKSKLGNRFSMPDLKNLANQISEETGIVIDRNAKRCKKVLITWFCENWKKIEHILDNDINCSISDKINIQFPEYMSIKTIEDFMIQPFGDDFSIINDISKTNEIHGKEEQMLKVYDIFDCDLKLSWDFVKIDQDVELHLSQQFLADIFDYIEIN